jgi:hypothetical protein
MLSKNPLGVSSLNTPINAGGSMMLATAAQYGGKGAQAKAFLKYPPKERTLTALLVVAGETRNPVVVHPNQL